MVRFIIVWFCLLVGLIMQAQVVKGIVANKQGEMLAFVTIIVQDKDGKNSNSFFTNEQGEFQLTTEQDTQVTFQYIGYKERVISIHSPELKHVILEEDNTVLNEVTVISKRPTIKREIDRLVFRVQDTPLTSTNAWDILKQTPGVSVLGDNISIRNSSSILVTINDKKVMLSGEQLKQLLESTEGTLVESVEVITTPPAKYEAEGNAVLNIKMKKNVNLGYKGSLSEQFRQGQYAYNTVSTNHIYADEKVNFTANYAFSNGNIVRNNWDNVIYEDGTTWSSDMTRKNKIDGRHSFNIETDVAIDSTFTFTVGGTGYINSKTKGVFVIPTLIYNLEHIVESNYVTTNDKKSNMDSYTGYFMFDKKWKANRKLLWSNYFTYDNQVENQFVFTELNFKDQEASESTYLSDDNSRTRLVVSALDYTSGEATSKWELGAKYSFIQAQYQLEFWDDELGSLQYRAKKSNLFEYQELNWAGYASYQKQWEKWQFKAGLRAEYTGIQTQNREEESNKQSYLKWFPTVYLMYEINDLQKLGFSYGKRINRPSYSWMNPAKSYFNMFSYFQGDPNLKPALSHNFNLTYNWNHLDVEVFFNYEKNPSMEISFQEEQTKYLIYHYTNINKRRTAGLQLSHPFKFTEWWTGSVYLHFQQQEDYFYGIDQILHKNSAFTFGSRVYSIFDIDKKSNWKAMITYGFYTPSVQGTFRVSGMQQTNVMVSRDFFKGKIATSLTFNNIFKSDIQTIKTKYANQNNYFRDYSDTQAVVIGLRYNFGNSKVKYDSKDIDIEEKQRL
ncbi:MULTISPECIES: outer membrane beta-barrel family protein [unclassified Myroides]|uniref:outer membrane beta-barrel family protein n=1 Tax=unclassified Myroides TaxID=2642485 RepID=UPI003100FC97